MQVKEMVCVCVCERENVVVSLRGPAMTGRLVQVVTLPSFFDIWEKLLLTLMTFSAGDMKYD